MVLAVWRIFLRTSSSSAGGEVAVSLIGGLASGCLRLGKARPPCPTSGARRNANHTSMCVPFLQSSLGNRGQQQPCKPRPRKLRAENNEQTAVESETTHSRNGIGG